MTEKIVFIRTFGCQMNVHDSQRMLDMLQAAGYRLADKPNGADLILINTCTVREKSRDKVLSAIGRYAILKRNRPGMVLGVTGCMAQQDGKRLIKQAKALDLVMSPDHISALPELVDRAREGQRTVRVGFADVDEYRFLQATPGGGGFGSQPTALITIQKGCDNHCAYCIVPSVRGPEVSRPADEILAEVEDLASSGVREVTLIGQNVNSYNRGSGSSQGGFVDLLTRVDAVPGLDRVRFITSNPKDFTAELARCFSTLPSLCPWLHLPVQSGSSRMLAKMERGYTRERYLELIALVREECPDIRLGTDIIVGFPGEEERDFLDTMELLEQIRFDYAYSFKYSVRPGTAAEPLGETLPEEEKLRRLNHLQAVQQNIAEERLTRWVGQELEVLVEGHSRQGTSQLSGRGPGNQVINFQAEGSGAGPGDLVTLKIERARRHSLWGSIVQVGATDN